MKNHSDNSDCCTDIKVLKKSTDTHKSNTDCPMYNDNKGALWLSESKDIKNLYYGNKMVECGEVKEVIK